MTLRQEFIQLTGELPLAGPFWARYFLAEPHQSRSESASAEVELSCSFCACWPKDIILTSACCCSIQKWDHRALVWSNMQTWPLDALRSKKSLLFMLEFALQWPLSLPEKLLSICGQMWILRIAGFIHVPVNEHWEKPKLCELGCPLPLRALTPWAAFSVPAAPVGMVGGLLRVLWTAAREVAPVICGMSGAVSGLFPEWLDSRSDQPVSLTSFPPTPRTRPLSSAGERPACVFVL